MTHPKDANLANLANLCLCSYIHTRARIESAAEVRRVRKVRIVGGRYARE